MGSYGSAVLHLGGKTHTSIYRHWSSEKVVIKVVMKGWPATALSVLRSLRTCSTCFSLITVEFPLVSTTSSHEMHSGFLHTICFAKYFERIYLFWVL